MYGSFVLNVSHSERHFNTYNIFFDRNGYDDYSNALLNLHGSIEPWGFAHGIIFAYQGSTCSRKKNGPKYVIRKKYIGTGPKVILKRYVNFTPFRKLWNSKRH